MIIDTSKQAIANFLEGHNPMKYVVAIECTPATNEAYLIINDPNLGKSKIKKEYKSFLWMNKLVGQSLYNGDRTALRNAMKKHNVSFTQLETANSLGIVPDRMKEGFDIMAECKGSWYDFMTFFKNGGIDPNQRKDESKPDRYPWRNEFVFCKPVEQFMIQTGIRLFKGMDDYDDLHRMQFDLETTGLLPTKSRTFQIGIRTNKPILQNDGTYKNFEMILETKGNNSQELRESERANIQMFGYIINDIQPDIITGYNSEDFDWNFLQERCRILSLPFDEIFIGLNRSGIKRQKSRLKLGAETVDYLQANLWGYNVLDISHSVRRAMAINSEIKSWSLKWISDYSGIAKPNRVYVPGDKIHETWADVDGVYYFNETNGDWFKEGNNTPEEVSKLSNGGYSKVKGDFIVKRYLCDDLWETEMVDGIYNQASFLMAKIIPTTFMRSSTMGTAGIWQLIMMAWSYENNLAVPIGQPQQTFVGGLSRLCEVGYRRNVVKLDYAALYPNTEITHDIFPEHDISGVMKGLLVYIAETRDEYKGLKGVYEKKAEGVKKEIDLILDNPDAVSELKKKYDEFSFLASNYDKKQLPIKILANSFFGSFGAPHVFNWGDIDCAEETTCRGRQYLRLMVSHFRSYGFVPLVADSVTFDTPVYIKNKTNGDISILPICDVYDDKTNVVKIGEQARDISEKPYQILAVDGWKDISYVYRHPTSKNIHQLSTKDRLVRVTEDHSVFQNRVQVKPNSLKRNDSIDVYKDFNYDFYNKHHLNEDDVFESDYYWMMGYFLGDGSSLVRIKKQKYKSKKTSKVNIYKTETCEFKISGGDLVKLNKLKTILEKYHPNLNFSIKDHRVSSSVFNLVCYSVEFAKWFNNNFYTSYREKSIPSFVLNTKIENKKAFIDGVLSSDGYGDELGEAHGVGMKSQVAMAGIGFLLTNLGVEYKLNLRNDKPNFIYFRLNNANRGGSSFTNKTKMKTDKIWNNKIVKNTCENGYVYDISTGDGTFVGGIGMVNLKNTDGLNFAIPDDIDNITYTPTGIHRFTEGNKGKVLSGVDAVVAEFNDLYMIGRMGLDIDDICASTINFSRKNYANDIIKKGKSKVKLVGNTIKSNKMPKYIEEFLAKGVRHLLDDEGYKFVELYYETVDNIVNYNIPLSKIASKARVKSTIDTYKEKCLKKNKAGNPMPRQAHMELVLKHELVTNIGDTIYYINTGNKKTDGDLKSIKSDDGMVTVELNCKLLRNEEIESDPNATTDEYNAKKYLDMFNKRIKKLMVCFNTDVRDNIIIDFVKSKEIFSVNEAGRKVYEDILQDRSYFTKEELKLSYGDPLEEKDQDDVDLDLMMLDDREVEFWKRVGKTPNNMTDHFWSEFLKDYEVRKNKEDEYYNVRYKIDLINFSLNLKELGVEPIQGFKEIFKKKYDLKLNEDNTDIEIHQGKYFLCNYSKLKELLPYFDMLEEWLVANPKKKSKHWMDKYSHTINYNELFVKMFSEVYNEEKLNHIPRVYKDYDLLYSEADKE